MQSSISPKEAQSHGGDVMKKLEGTFLAGLLALCVAGPALAHSTVLTHGHADSAWSGQITVWGGSAPTFGWSGTVSVGAAYPYAPAYLPVRVYAADGHRHGPGCRHGHGHGYGHSDACCAGFADRHGHGNGHRHRKGHGPHRH